MVDKKLKTHIEMMKWVEDNIKGTKLYKFILCNLKIKNFRFEIQILKLLSDIPNNKTVIEDAIHYKLFIRLKGIIEYLCKDIIFCKWGIVLLRNDKYHLKIRSKEKSYLLSVSIIKYLK